MAFDRDAFLADSGETAVANPPATAGFDREAFLGGNPAGFDRDKFLGLTRPPPSTTPAADQAIDPEAGVSGFMRGLDLKSIPLDVLRSIAPFTESYHAIKQTWDMLHGTPVEKAIPESQKFVGIEKKPLRERIKVGGETVLDLLFAKQAGEGIRAPGKAAEAVETKPQAPIVSEADAHAAAQQVGGLKFDGFQTFPADTGIPDHLNFTITEAGKETSTSFPVGSITPDKLAGWKTQKLAEYAEAAEFRGEPTGAGAEGSIPSTTPTTVTDSDLHISSIANKFIEERVARGEIGDIAPGQGPSVVELAQRGLNMPPERVAEAVSRLVQEGETPIDDAAAIRGEEARLSQKSNDLSRIAGADLKNVEAQLAADNAFKDLTDFHNGPVARLKQNWASQGRTMQGEIPVDLSTFNGLREKWLKDTGELPPASIEPTLRKAAKRVTETVEEDTASRARLGEEIVKATKRRKLPTAEDVRANIRERMGLGPCRT